MIQQKLQSKNEQSEEKTLMTPNQLIMKAHKNLKFSNIIKIKLNFNKYPIPKTTFKFIENYQKFAKRGMPTPLIKNMTFLNLTK